MSYEGGYRSPALGSPASDLIRHGPCMGRIFRNGFEAEGVYASPAVFWRETFRGVGRSLSAAGAFLVLTRTCCSSKRARDRALRSPASILLRPFNPRLKAKISRLNSTHRRNIYILRPPLLLFLALRILKVATGLLNTTLNRNPRLRMPQRRIDLRSILQLHQILNKHLSGSFGSCAHRDFTTSSAARNCSAISTSAFRSLRASGSAPPRSSKS